MVIRVNSHASKEDIEKLCRSIEAMGNVHVHKIVGENYTVLGIVGDTSSLDIQEVEALDYVEKVTRIQEPFKKANRLLKEEDTVIPVGNTTVGGELFSVMAGPCSVESEEQILEVARRVKAAGANILRGGAFKPRTSPYSFQGLEAQGLELLKLARKETGLPIVSELMSTAMIDKFVEDVDIIQIGARNMSNFDLLKEVGKTDKPILLKRGMSATVEEFLMSAEYIMASGNEKVILCERGIRTFETFTRNTLDLSVVPVLKKLTHLPVIIDPSHATGKWWLVEPLSKAALAVGADGLMIEVHNDPANAKCDGPQSLKPEKFDSLMGTLKQMAGIFGKKL
jgi:3-deoxy-7-phosphoheptulonate synthase